ncbi:hypothetical protein MUK42_10797 [Musa troglodytarum]|uniref:Uncharacterized protein n=1 Tax=Musa troglodytarum TaxID=320322 RepID=A0A9E7KID5_9LILI|nr:hypothetical protein MUK42_10797 [Musa troglodytarum]
MELLFLRRQAQLLPRVSAKQKGPIHRTAARPKKPNMPERVEILSRLLRRIEEMMHFHVIGHHCQDATTSDLMDLKIIKLCGLMQMGIVLAALLKAKTLAVKNKAGLTKTRLAFLGMLSKRKVLASAVSNKIHALKGHDGGGGSGQALEGYSKAMVMYNAAGEEEVFSSPADHRESLEHVEEDEYPDCGLDDEDEDDELMDSPCSAMDLVRSSEEDGLEFNLEGEIDRAADVFIRRFRREMRLQAQESPKK